MRSFTVCAVNRIVLCGDHITEDERAGACSTHGKVCRTAVGNVMVMSLHIFCWEYNIKLRESFQHWHLLKVNTNN
jgi:hypothetical protein